MWVTVLLALVKVMGMALCGLAIGLWATWVVLEAGMGFGAVRAREWQTWPKAGTLEIDPYTRARLARSGEIPLGLAEGISLAAMRDQDGEALHARCSYRFFGRMPPARYWTLTLVTPEGWLTEQSGLRHGLTSAEIVRRADGEFDIAISPYARPGNWLPLSGAEDFMLLLRLYDTAISATASVIDAGALPRVTKEACQ